MKKIIYTIFLLIASVAFALEPSAEYYKECTRLLKQDSSKAFGKIDFLRYRQSFFKYVDELDSSARTTDYTNTSFVIAAWEANAGDIAYDYSEKVLETNYANIAAHITLGMFLKDPSAREFHSQLGMLLYASMRKTGNAKSIETAMTVTEVYEEYVHLALTKGKFLRQDLMKQNGRIYDVLMVRYEEGLGVLYFDVTALFPDANDYKEGLNAYYAPDQK